MTDVNAIQVGGTHYKTSFQHWDFVYKVLGGRYLEGCATKYPSRWRKKNGLEDLKKSVHYIDKLLDGFKKGKITPLHGSRPEEVEHHVPMLIHQFCEANDLSGFEASIMSLLGDWKYEADLLTAKTLLLDLIAREQEKANAR